MTMENRHEVVAALEWEGGIWGCLEYGITPDQMPDDETKMLWSKLYGNYLAMVPVIQQLHKVLDY